MQLFLRRHSLFRGGESIHVLYLSKSMDTYAKKWKKTVLKVLTQPLFSVFFTYWNPTEQWP